MAAEAADLGPLVRGGGLLIGMLFGAVAHRSNFCTMGAISDVVNMGHWGRIRMWALAVAVAMAGTSALAIAGLADVGQAVAMRPQIAWMSLLVGGALFGVGMTLAGGCANKNLVRLGGGSLRSLVVLLVMGLAASMTMRGLFAQWRSQWLDPHRLDLAAAGWPDQGLGTALARASGLAEPTALGLIAGLLVLGLLVFVLKDRRFRGNRWQVFGGAALGALVVAGWWVSGHLGHGEHPQTMEQVYFATNTRTIESLSFVAPTAHTIELLQLWTDRSLHPSFGVLLAVGVVMGSAGMALMSGRFRWEGFASLQDLRNQLIGAVLMGFGGVTALGCTVGQGLSGLSTLAIGSFLAVAGIVAGSVGMLKVWAWQAERG